MRVAVEVDYSSSGMRGGHHLINQLLSQFAVLDRQTEYLVFGFFYRDFDAKIQQVRLPEAANINLWVKRWPQSLVSRLEWDFKLPLIEFWLGLKGVDVYHCFRPPVRGGDRMVLTMPDITPRTHPDWHDAEGHRLWQRVTLPGLMKAKRIMTLSRYIKEDIVRELNIPEQRVRDVPLGIDHAVFKPVGNADSLEQARKKYRLPEQFFLMVGPLDDVTNFRAVVEAMAGPLAVDLPPVVVVGPLDGYARRMQVLAQERGVANRFIWTGYLFHGDLALLYNMALALVYPSLLRGTELPPYEAMACGLPVITSLDEVVADAGLLIDARSAQDILKSLRIVCESPSLRLNLRQRGLKRAAEFSWERTAKETLQLYKEVAGSA